MKNLIPIPAFTLILSLVLAGCGAAPAPGGGGDVAASDATAKPSCLTLIAVDRSRSTEGIRAALLTTAFDVGTAFDPSRDTMRLYRFGHDIEEVYADLPEDDDSFATVIAKEVKVSDPVLGTNYPRVLGVLADAAENTTEGSVRILIVGDGQNDYRGEATFAKQYRAAAQRIAKNRRIVWVRFWGVGTGTREELRDVFRPLGARLQILSLDQNPLKP